MYIKNIDLWFDHKPSQSIDPFIVDYFDKKTETFKYDKIIFAPNLCGHTQIIFHEKEIDPSLSPNFDGGIIFLENNKPIRLYLCQTNEIVTKELGYKYGMRDIVAVVRSKNKITGTNKSLYQLLKQNQIKIEVDNCIKSKFVSKNGYKPKNHPVLESADHLYILKGPTFLDNLNNWECANFYPDIEMNLCVLGQDFEINVEHKGFIQGIKQNISGLRESQKGKKLYGIALQKTENPVIHSQMTEYAQNFTNHLAVRPSNETRKIDLAKSLLDLK